MAEFNQGVWFQAACSGLWYRSPDAAGDVSNVRVDGVLYAGPERSDVCEHGIPEGDWCEACNLEYKRAALEMQAEDRAFLERVHGLREPVSAATADQE